MTILRTTIAHSLPPRLKVNKNTLDLLLKYLKAAELFIFGKLYIFHKAPLILFYSNVCIRKYGLKINTIPTCIETIIQYNHLIVLICRMVSRLETSWSR